MKAARFAEALAWARTAGIDRLDAQLLLSQATGLSRSRLIAHDDGALDAATAGRFRAAVERRAAGEPLAYLLGEREFHGLMLSVGPAVLVPRPDTETLVDWALELLPTLGARPSAVDLGTGSGAIALAVKQAWPTVQMTATDRSLPALEVARHNAVRLGLAVEWVAGDWWQPLAGRRFEMALSNPPYIAANDPHLQALGFEPQEALVSGPDGLDALRALVTAAPRGLQPGGWLLLEHGFDQAAAVADMFRQTGFRALQTRRDLAGHVRCSAARWPTAHGAVDAMPQP